MYRLRYDPDKRHKVSLVLWTWTPAYRYMDDTERAAMSPVTEAFFQVQILLSSRYSVEFIET